LDFISVPTKNSIFILSLDEVQLLAHILRKFLIYEPIYLIINNPGDELSVDESLSTIGIEFHPNKL
jgi:hypothetical protein